MPLKVGSIVQGVVACITDFGAFVKLPEGLTGLVHISEVSDSYVKDIHDYLKEKDMVKVKVLSIGQEGKISLSIRKAEVKRKVKGPMEISWEDKGSHLTFEDRLSKFLKDSEERFQDIKRNREAKRGGGGYKRSSDQY